MAAMNGKSVLILSLGALVVLMMMAQPAEASSFRVWSGPGCGGSSSVLDACGCNTIPSNQRGGYQWTYTGQTCATYNSPGCTGVAHTRFTGSVNGCQGFGWQSVFIQC